MKDDKYISEINHYILKYGSLLSFKSISIEELKSNIAILDELSDFILDLFCKYGIKDDYEPNDKGNRLEELLDFIMEIRVTFHDNR